MKILALHTDSKFALSLLYNVFARNKKASINDNPNKKRAKNQRIYSYN